MIHAYILRVGEAGSRDGKVDGATTARWWEGVVSYPQKILHFKGAVFLQTLVATSSICRCLKELL
jgi:hypothetical protein